MNQATHQCACHCVPLPPLVLQIRPGGSGNQRLWIFRHYLGQARQVLHLLGGCSSRVQILEDALEHLPDLMGVTHLLGRFCHGCEKALQGQNVVCLLKLPLHRVKGQTSFPGQVCRQDISLQSSVRVLERAWVELQRKFGLEKMVQNIFLELLNSARKSMKIFWA